MERYLSWVVLLTTAMSLIACGSSSGTISNTDIIEDAAETTTIVDVVADPASFAVDTSRFDLASLETIEEVDCVLTNGATTTCYDITVSGFPSDRDELGYFCPANSTTGADQAGKWFDNGVLYDLTGEFIANLSTFYNDDMWDLLNDDGTVRITDNAQDCQDAANPNVPPELNNHCVVCEIEYFTSGLSGDGVSFSITIPSQPVPRDSGNGAITTPGVAFNGVKLEAAAPVEAILGAYTIAAFDDCVGHVNPFEGYHYHGANHGDGDCPVIEFESDGHAGAFGYALDGYMIYGMLDENGEESTDLDECRGHTDDVRGYHYHSAGPGENAFIGCYRGEIAQSENTGIRP